MTLSIIALAMCAPLTMAYIWQRIKKTDVASAIMLKALISLLVVLAAVLAVVNNFGRENIYILGGLICCLVGDILLENMVFYPAEGRYLFGGLSAFSIGHVFYILSIGEYVTTIVTIIAAAVSCFLIAVTWFLGIRLKNLTFSATIYAFVITLFIATAINGLAFSSPRMILLSVGSILFALSDSLLTLIYFKDCDTPPFVAANYVLYIIAQICICVTTII